MSVKSLARATAAACVLAAALGVGATANAQSHYGSSDSRYSNSYSSSYQSQRHHKSKHHKARYESARYQDGGRYENSRYQGEGRRDEGGPGGMERASYSAPAFQVPVSRVPNARNALKGAAVRDQDGNSVGSVRDVMASPDGQVDAVRINVGGMWGVNGKTVEVDAHEFRYEADRHELTADLSKGQIESLPGIKP